MHVVFSCVVLTSLVVMVVVPHQFWGQRVGEEKEGFF